MTTRYYSSTAVPTILSGGVGAGATALTVGSLVGYPTQYPYVVALDWGTATAELVLVTSVASTTLTVTRGYAGTAGLAHSAGASVTHAVTHLDFKEWQDHGDATTNVHGIANTANLLVKTSWQDWAPALTQGSLVVPTTTAHSRYRRVGDDVSYRGKVTVNSAFSSGTGPLTVALPVPSKKGGIIGYGMFTAIGAPVPQPVVLEGTDGGSTAVVYSTANGATYTGSMVGSETLSWTFDYEGV